MSQLLKTIFQTNHQLKQLLFKIALMDLSDQAPEETKLSATIDSPQPEIIQNKDNISLQEGTDSSSNLLNKIILELQERDQICRTKSRSMRNQINETVIEKYHLTQIKLNQQKESDQNNKVAIKERKNCNKRNILEAIEEESDEEQKESNTTEEQDSLQQLEFIKPVANAKVQEDDVNQQQILKQSQIRLKLKGQHRFRGHKQ